MSALCVYVSGLAGDIEVCVCFGAGDIEVCVCRGWLVILSGKPLQAASSVVLTGYSWLTLVLPLLLPLLLPYPSLPLFHCPRLLSLSTYK